MRDYSVLANACKRAGKSTVAAHLIFNRGVLYENMGESGAALKCYKVSTSTCTSCVALVARVSRARLSFVDPHPLLRCRRCAQDLLRASLEAGDPVGEALACNCIGVILQNQEEPNMTEAIRYHHQHLAVADVPGAC